LVSLFLCHMARPSKNFCDYFPHDRDMRNHKKIRALRNKFGITGYAIWSLLLEYLTGANYNKFEYTDLEFELIAGDFGVSVTEITDVVNYCIKLELLFLKNGFIHSPSLDDNLLPVYEKRQTARGESSKQPRINGQFANNNTESSGVSVTEMPQSRLDKIRLDNKEKKKDEEKNQPPPPEENISDDLKNEFEKKEKKVAPKKENETVSWEVLVENFFDSRLPIDEEAVKSEIKFYQGNWTLEASTAVCTFFFFKHKDFEADRQRVFEKIKRLMFDLPDDEVWDRIKKWVFLFNERNDGERPKRTMRGRDAWPQHFYNWFGQQNLLQKPELQKSKNSSPKITGALTTVSMANLTREQQNEIYKNQKI